MSHAIEIEKLTKTFRPSRGIGRWFSASPITDKIHVLQDVTLYVEEGEVFGLLGPNGAGKTTLLKILSTLIRPNGGVVRVLGHDVVQAEERVREQVGLFYSDERSFYWRLSGRENLRFFGSLMNLTGPELDGRIHELATLLNMEGFLEKRYDAYSTGMRQRLSLARGFLRRPRVLLMDEPTRGLDPTSSMNLLERVRSFAKDQGTTILMVTHSLSEAETFCDRIGILHHGRMVCQGRIQELRASYRPAGLYHFSVRSTDPKLLENVKRLPQVTALRWTNGVGDLHVDLEIREPAKNLSKVFDLFRERGVSITHVDAGESELSSIFAEATKKEVG